MKVAQDSLLFLLQEANMVVFPLLHLPQQFFCQHSGSEGLIGTKAVT